VGRLRCPQSEKSEGAPKATLLTQAAPAAPLDYSLFCGRADVGGKVATAFAARGWSICSSACRATAARAGRRRAILASSTTQFASASGTIASMASADGAVWSGRPASFFPLACRGGRARRPRRLRCLRPGRRAGRPAPSPRPEPIPPGGRHPHAPGDRHRAAVPTRRTEAKHRPLTRGRSTQTGSASEAPVGR